MRVEYISEDDESGMPEETGDYALPERPSNFVRLTQRFLIVMLLTTCLIIIAACVQAIRRDLNAYLKHDTRPTTSYRTAMN